MPEFQTAFKKSANGCRLVEPLTKHF